MNEMMLVHFLMFVVPALVVIMAVFALSTYIVANIVVTRQCDQIDEQLDNEDEDNYLERLFQECEQRYERVQLETEPVYQVRYECSVENDVVRAFADNKKRYLTYNKFCQA